MLFRDRRLGFWKSGATPWFCIGDSDIGKPFLLSCFFIYSAILFCQASINGFMCSGTSCGRHVPSQRMKLDKVVCSARYS